MDREISINIAGRQYSILSEDEKHVRKLEGHINSMFDELARSNPNVPHSRLLVLVCLHLAEEIIAQRKSFNDFLFSIDRDLGEIMSGNDRLIEESRKLACEVTKD